MLFALAAEEAKLEVVAHLGAWNPHASHPAIRQREQWIAGSIYRWMPSVDFVHLNPGIFTVMYFLGLPFVAQFGMLALPFGDGLNAPPSNEDIARVAVGSLMNPERHIGKCYRPTGPKLIPGDDAAEVESKSDKLSRNCSILAGNLSNGSVQVSWSVAPALIRRTIRSISLPLEVQKMGRRDRVIRRIWTSFFY